MMPRCRCRLDSCVCSEDASIPSGTSEESSLHHWRNLSWSTSATRKDKLHWLRAIPCECHLYASLHLTFVCNVCMPLSSLPYLNLVPRLSAALSHAHSPSPCVLAELSAALSYAHSLSPCVLAELLAACTDVSGTVLDVPAHLFWTVASYHIPEVAKCCLLPFSFYANSLCHRIENTFSCVCKPCAKLSPLPRTYLHTVLQFLCLYARPITKISIAAILPV